MHNGGCQCLTVDSCNQASIGTWQVKQPLDDQPKGHTLLEEALNQTFPTWQQAGMMRRKPAQKWSNQALFHCLRLISPAFRTDMRLVLFRGFKHCSIPQGRVEMVEDANLSLSTSAWISLCSSGLVRQTESAAASLAAFSSHATLLNMKKMAGSICSLCMVLMASDVLGTRCHLGLSKGYRGSPIFSSLR